MSLARRVAEHFVLPADADPAHARGGRGPRRRRRADASPAGAPPTRACAVAPPRAPASLAVLAPAADAAALGAALALALARRERAPAALVCLWAPAGQRPSWRAPALPAAARVTRMLCARGHDARATGRLAVVRLAVPCEQAAAEAVRASAAAGSAPTVLALAGQRAAAFEELLAQHDLVVVAIAPGADPALARLAVAGLERATTCEVPPAHPARSLATAGVALLPSARRALAAPVAVLS